MCSLVSPPISVPPCEAPYSMRGRPNVKYKGELETQNNPQHRGYLPKHTGALRERARQRGSKLKEQSWLEGQIGDHEHCSLTEGGHPWVFPH